MIIQDLKQKLDIGLVESGSMQKIGEILVQKGYVTQQQVDGVLAVKGEDAQVGQVLIQWGMITQEQLMEALEIQAPPPPPPPPATPLALVFKLLGDRAQYWREGGGARP